MSALAPPPAANTIPTGPRRRPTWWHPIHTLFSTLASAYLLYILAMLLILSTNDWKQPFAPQLDRLIHTPLAVSLVCACIAASATSIRAMIVRCTKVSADIRAANDQAREEWQTGCNAWMGTVMETLAAIKENGSRPQVRTSDTTVDLRRQARPGSQIIYAGVAAFQGGSLDGLMDTLRAQVDSRVDAAIGERVQEYGNQRWFEGYAAGREDTGNGSVVALQPRNGHRTSLS